MFVFFLGGCWYAHRSSSSWRSTSPMICPMLCSALRSSSVLSNCFLVSFTSSRSLRTLASSSCSCGVGRDGQLDGQSEVATSQIFFQHACPKKAFTQISNGRGVMGPGLRWWPGLRACDERLDSYLVLQHEPPILADRRLLGIGSLHRRRNLRGRHLAHSQTSLPLSTAQPPVWTLPDPGREGARVPSRAARPRRCGRVDRRRARVMRPAACVRVWHPTRAPREITPGLKLSNQARRLSVT